MKLEMRRPDDWHLHVRDGSLMATVVPHTASCFARAIIMPNLTPPVTTVERAQRYRARIASAIPRGCDFEPLMTLYLTDSLTSEEIQRASESPIVCAAKLYPAGATTNSSAGVTAIENVYATLETMQECGLPLLVHGEITTVETDIFDREARFIEDILVPLIERFPRLRVVLEHVTTREAVQFVREAPSCVAATITPHHLLFNRNDMLVGGIRPHYYCLPILKRRQHQEMLIEAAISGNPRFFLGTDSAPHSREDKESACGCAGCYSAPAALGLYAEVFEAAGALDRLEGFASLFGADFYQLPRNRDTITLEKVEQRIPEAYAVGGGRLVPLRAGQTVAWRLRRN